MLSQTLPDNFLGWNTIGLDLETTCLYGSGSDPYRDRVLLISLSNGRESIVLQPGPWLAQLWEWLRYGTVVIHNGEFDLRFLWSLGFERYPASIWDTLIIERVLTNGMNSLCGLSDTAWRNCSVILDKEMRSSFRGHLSSSFTQRQLQYAINDVKYLIPIMESQQKRCREYNLFETAELENSLVPVVAAMEYRGVGFNQKYWEKLVRKEQRVAEYAYKDAIALLDLGCSALDLFGGVSQSINLNSRDAVLSALKQQGIYLDDAQESTFETYMKEHPDCIVLQHILDYKKAMKRIGFNYPKYINPITGRIHTSYNQVGARSGRFTSKIPNLQNVVAEQEYRDGFEADQGYFYITADYAQQEVRAAAEASGDKRLQEVCHSSDIHLENGRRIYNAPTMVKSDPRRRVAKNTGFAMFYGAGAENIAAATGISIEEARRVVNYVKTEFPDVNRWFLSQIDKAEREGWVATLGGRRRWFLNVNGKDRYKWANAARNSPIQGTGADMLKRGMVYVDTELRRRELDAALILTVHDELVTRSHQDCVEETVQVIREQMERAGQYYITCVPTPVDIAVDTVWRKA